MARQTKAAPPARTKTGADLLCDALVANGIDVCFANPGTSEMHFVAALDRRPDIRCSLALFEGVATGAADAYARVAGRPAAVLLHTGPGLGNGFANLHNARRAHAPTLVVVGDHARRHLRHDAPLTSDVEALASACAVDVRRVRSVAAIPRDVAASLGAAQAKRGPAVLILPADLSWSPAPAGPIAVPRAKPPRPRFDRRALAAFVADAKGGRKCAIFLGADALRPQALDRAAAIAAVTGATLVAPTFCENIARGRGRPAIERVPYFPDPASAFLDGFEAAALVGARAPVNFFGYPGKPSLPLPARCVIRGIATPEGDVMAALDALARAFGAGAPPEAPRFALPDAPAPGRLDDHAVGAIVARALPEGAIVIDELLTSAPGYFAQARGAPPHDHLQLTGGAIGAGLPLALGAGIAAPGRKIVALQADGSAMYTVQALWSMAREKVDATVVIFSNRAYRILYLEMANAGAPPPGANARAMFDLDRPPLDFAKIAEGMGMRAARVDTTEGFASAFADAMAATGPRLIEAVI